MNRFAVMLFKLKRDPMFSKTKESSCFETKDVSASKNMGHIFNDGTCQVIAHDLQTGEPLEWLPHEEPVYGLSVHPSQVLLASKHQKEKH